MSYYLKNAKQTNERRRQVKKDQQKLAKNIHIQRDGSYGDQPLQIFLGEIETKNFEEMG